MPSTFPTSPIRSSVLLRLGVALPLWLSVSPALAHIDVDSGGSHRSRVSGGFSIKDAPCGVPDAPRSNNVYKYRPGATINIKVAETIPHPGYFRISFDDDGTDDFVIPSGTSGEFGDCGGNPNCGTGKEDYCSNETVLLDKLDMHAAGGTKTYTWSVTLPNVECTNCTLQIIQMMNDFAPFHSPATYPADDIYYHCIDIELSNDAPESTDMPVTNNGMVCSGGTMGAAGAPATAGAGGASSAAGAGGGAAGASGSAAAIGGSAAPPLGGAGGTSSATAGTSGGNLPTAGAPAGMMSAAGAAGASAPATGSMTNSQSTAGAGTAATSGTAMNAAGSVGGEAIGSPTPTASDSSGGCQAASGSAGGLFAPAMLGLMALGWRSYRRRRAA